MGSPASAGTSRSLYLIALSSLAAVQVLSTMAFNAGPVLAPAAAPDMGVSKDDVAYFVALVYLTSIFAILAIGAVPRRLTQPYPLGFALMAVCAALCAITISGRVRRGER